MSMRQVSKQHYEVLKNYHPAEVRYYVDTGTRKGGKPAKKRKRNMPNKRGQIVQLSQNGHTFKHESSAYARMNKCLHAVLENDPTKVLTRGEVTDAIMAGGGFALGQVRPFISDAILRYKILRVRD